VVAVDQHVPGVALRAQDQPGQRVEHVGQVVVRPDDQVGPVAGLETADVVAAKAAVAALGGRAQPVGRQEGGRAEVPLAGQEQGHARLGEQPADLVAGHPVHAQPDRGAGRGQVDHPGDAPPEPAVAGGAVGDPGPVAGGT
jgi:hypothetical protein